ncbi:MAG: hypothetical protein AB7S70_15070 [Hyphomicrobium sp.]|uniref:hypothetical protein n=1 Tax=Hyphomicrobium sp. TaxID=82 RepID=UPI003D0E0942
MTHYIPRLARIRAGKGAAGKPVPAGPRPRERAVNVDQLARLMPDIRRSLAIPRAFSDAALLASLVAIARHTSHAARWRTAEASTLGQHLASGEKERERSLVTLLSLLPTP